MGSERYLRPESVVLGDSSLIPPENQIRPPPNRFTHQVVTPAPFYYGRRAESKAPDGELAVGTKVVVLRYEDDGRCRVADGRGLYVEVGCDSLAELEPRPPA